MTGDQAIEWIHSRLPFGVTPGLERVERLLACVGNPHKKTPVIHVAGTNGKGTTCTVLSEALTAQGYKTGLFISPYVTDFCERIQINGAMISRDALASCADKLYPHVQALDAEGIQVTEFELITAMAFLCFEEEKCDIAVLETGLGGRFDSTNCVDTPIVSVITHIAMDHMEVLGDTLPKIAFEKSGIIKPDGDTVCYPEQEPEAMKVIREQAARQNNRLHIPDTQRLTVTKSHVLGSVFSYKGKEWTIPLGGIHQVYNTITAMEALRIAGQKGFPVTDEALRQGLSDVKMPARQEVLSQNPLILLDGAHNPDGLTALAETVKTLQAARIIGIAGMLRDKDTARGMSIMAPLFDKLYTLTVNHPRGLSGALLAEQYGGAEALSDVSEIKKIVKNLVSDDILVVFGSLYLAGEVRPLLLEAIKK